MTTKIELYNIALGTYIGTETLATLTENRPQRYALDRVYDASLLYMLEQGLWKFANRTVQLTKDVVGPTLGRQYSFTIPTDFVRLAMIASDESLDSELLDYREANGKWLTNVDSIYVSYVSKDASYGLDLDLYPENYKQALGAWLAYQSVLPINKDRGDRADLLKLYKLTLSDAKRLDATDEAVKRQPAGTWVRSRGISTNGTSRGLR